MRIWLGTEVEHNTEYGKQVAFIECEYVDVDNILNKLIELNLLHNIDVMYFGAGEVDIKSFKYTDNCKKLLKKFNVVTTLETSMNNIASFGDFVFDNVVIRTPQFNINSISSCNRFIKVRHISSVGIAHISKFDFNSIATVDNGMYYDDILVYQD